MSMKNSDIGRIGEPNNPFHAELFREGGGPHAEEGQIGMSSPVAAAAMCFDLYCRRYGLDRELLATIPLTFRAHARLTPDAIARQDLTLEEYRQARMIIEPLRLYDCSPVGDGAVCIIVGGAEQARATQTPIWILGAQGIQASREHFIFAPRGLGMAQQSTTRLTWAEARSANVYGMAGMTPEDIDVLGLYDSFSPLPLYALEDFGFCEAGQALSWVQKGRVAIGGEFPANTAGGQLSQAQMNGWGQIRELVLQLRGGLGARQVVGARTGMWMSVGSDALILASG
jgi:acetyl-CoA acetyltransferase